MGLIENAVDFALRRMSKEERINLIKAISGKFLKELTPDDKNQMIRELLPEIIRDVRLEEFLPMTRPLFASLLPKLIEKSISGLLNEQTLRTAQEILAVILRTGICKDELTRWIAEFDCSKQSAK